MNLKALLLSVGMMLTLPYAIAKVIPENIRQARLIEKAPRQTVTVTSKWTKFINPSTDAYWISFQEPVANTQEVQITREAWNSAPLGGRVTIAVLPDGRPHTLESGGSVAIEQFMLVAAILLWLGSTGYVIAILTGWLRRKSRVDAAVG